LEVKGLHDNLVLMLLIWAVSDVV